MVSGCARLLFVNYAVACLESCTGSEYIMLVLVFVSGRESFNEDK